MKTNKNQFMNYLVDCIGESEQEAENLAIEYRNNLEDYLRDCGANDIAIEEVKEYLK